MQTKQRTTNRATDAADILIQSFVTHLPKQQRKKEKKKKKCFDVYVDWQLTFNRLIFIFT